MADLLFANLRTGGGLYFFALNTALGGPTITAQPSNASVTAPATATFSVTATGTAPITYQWLRSTNGGVSYANVVGGTGATTASYTTPATSSGATPSGNNGDRYVCDVTDATGTTRSNAALLTVSGGAQVTNVDGDDVVTSTQTAATFTGTGLGATTGDRTVRLVQGAIAIDQTQTAGNATSGTFNVAGFGTGVGLAYGLATFRAVVTGQNADRPVTIVVPAGRNAVNVGTPWPNEAERLRSTPDLASGDQIEWQGVVGGTISDVTVDPSGRFNAASGVTSFQWRLRDVSDGSWSALYTETLGGVPTITTQPQNRSVTVGQQATFSVVATGPAPLTYQWNRSNDNGVTFAPVSGATSSSYTTSVTVLGDNGAVFRVDVSNAFGTRTSNPANLTVAPAGDTTPPTAPTNVSAVLGATVGTVVVAWNAATDNVGVVGYRLFQNNVRIGPDPITGLTFTAGPLAPGTYQYNVRALDAAGNQSAPTSPVFATVPTSADVSPPTIPTALAVVGGTVGPTTATVTWAASSDSGSGVAFYVVMLNGQDWLTVAHPMTTGVLANLTPNTPYLVTVRAVDVAGNASAPSAAVAFTTLPATGGTGALVAALYLRGAPFVREASRAVLTWSAQDDDNRPAMPLTLRWRLDDEVSGVNVVPWTTLPATQSGRIVVPASANDLLDESRRWERRVLTLEANAGTANAVSDAVTYEIRNSVGL